MRKAVKAILGATLVLAAMAACSDDPLSADRDKAAYFLLNPTFANVKVAGETKVTAVVMNKNGVPIGAAVTAEPCDARITALADSTRSAYEEPERFVVKGVSAGTSCLIVNGGGLKDTVGITVVP